MGSRGKKRDEKSSVTEFKKVEWEVSDENRVPSQYKRTSTKLIDERLNNPEHPEWRGQISGITIKG